MTRDDLLAALEGRTLARHVDEFRETAERLEREAMERVLWLPEVHQGARPDVVAFLLGFIAGRISAIEEIQNEDHE